MFTKFAVFGKTLKPQQYGNFAKYELYLINLVSCHDKTPLEVGIIDILNFSFDICCMVTARLGLYELQVLEILSVGS
jgi:hypothetical protein